LGQIVGPEIPNDQKQKLGQRHPGTEVCQRPKHGLAGPSVSWQQDGPGPCPKAEPAKKFEQNFPRPTAELQLATDQKLLE
jgi:hypothetical protein